MLTTSTFRKWVTRLAGFCLFFNLNTSLSAQCDPMADSLALVEFYTALDGPNWTNSWDLSTPFAGWYGVEVNEDGCVIGIDMDGNPNGIRERLSGNNLTGTIPQNINLPFIKSLILNRNTLSSTLLDFTDLSQLEVFSCYRCLLNGNIPNFTNLPRLLTLDLGYNRFSGDFPDFSGISLLEYLNISEQLTEPRIPNFSNLPNLETLFIGNPGSFGAEKEPLPDFNLLTNLRSLSINDAGLTNTKLEVYLTNLNLNILTVLNEQVDQLPDLSNQQFSRLDIRANRFTFEDVLPLFSSVLLTFSYGFQDKIYQEETITLVEGENYEINLGIDEEITTNNYRWFKDNTFYGDYSTNRLPFNNFTAADAGVYRCEVTNRNAPDLTLESHDITLNIGQPCDRQADSLELVRFYNTMGGINWRNTWDLSQPMDTWYGVKLNNNGCLEILDLSGDTAFNNTSCCSFGNNVNGILSADINLPNLIRLNLARNYLIRGVLPDFQFLPSLRELILFSCTISGEIPNFSELPQLTQIGLAYNSRVVGTLPDFSKCPRLENISMLNNNLTGISSGIIEHPTIQEIGIYGNRLTALPDLSMMPSLQNLYIQSNELTFEDIIPTLDILNVFYDQQAMIHFPESKALIEGEDIIIDLGIDIEVPDNVYTWYKDGTEYTTITGSNQLLISSPDSDDLGIYTCRVTNSRLPQLTLESHPITVSYCIDENYQVIGDATPKLIPDNTGTSLSIPFDFSSYFLSDVVVDNSTTFTLTVQLEHSWADDLNIRLISPTGNGALLTDGTINSLNDLDFGEPNLQDGTDPVAGVPYTYTWIISQDNTFPSLGNWKGQNPRATVVPSLTFSPDYDYGGIMGNALSGVWKLEITDNFNQDNGYVFGASLTINGQAAFVQQHPADQQVAVGETATFTTAANLSETTYQWEIADENGTFNTIPDATNATLEIPNVTTDHHNKQYRCLLTNSCGVGISEVATLRIAGALPLELLHFNGITKSAGNYLVWETATESNVQLFELQTSTDGSTNWQTIHEQAPTNNGKSNTYQYLHRKPAQQQYYRLRSVEQDGSVHFSNTILLETNAVTNVDIQPNPTNSIVNVQLPRATKTIDYQLFTPSGQLVQHRQIVNDSVFQIDLTELPAGIYQLKIIDSERVWIKSIIKQ